MTEAARAKYWEPRNPKPRDADTSGAVTGKVIPI